MPLRVTLSMLNSQFLTNLNNNLLRTADLQNQLASGKIINKPSDDPVGITYAMRYRSEIAANEQHRRNLDAGYSFLENLDSVLDHTVNLLQRARELTIQGANDTNSAESRVMIAAEIDQIYEEYVNIGNSKFNGKFIFNGQLVDVKPYDREVADPIEAVTDTRSLEYEVGLGINMEINLTGNQVFGNVGQEDHLFQIMKNLSTALRSNNRENINSQLRLIDTRMDKILESRAVVGARVNRLEFLGTRLSDIELNLRKILSETEDANMAEIITAQKTNESVYQASLSTGAKILQPTLVDFLR